MKTTSNILLLVFGIFILVTLSGCFQGGPPALSHSDLEVLKTELEKIDSISGDVDVKLEKERLDSEQQKLDKKNPQKALYLFLIAYCAEKLGNYEEAIPRYEAVGRSHYKSMAFFRIGEVASHVEGMWEADKRALKGYTGASGYAPQGNILVRYPALASEPLKEWKVEELRVAANSRADKYQRRATSYKAIDAIVTFLGKNPRFSYALAILLIALVVKVITTPLSNRQIKSMREMQAIQPLLTEIQRKHKGDREALMKAQMKLFKEHKINPMGGCLPLLVQMPFLIWVYRAVWAYNWQFEGKSFLWISNLAVHDYPLLILYAGSLYFSQKLTTPPTADPQQQQTQRMMAIIFPFMFLFLFKFMPAAFILYWFAQNVLMTGHQYYLLRKTPPSAVAPAGPPEKKATKKGGEKK
ncbi:MAG: membrane protein insertase YidC [Armatimonadetes bacterium]|nr:membrane protein insertase YidC [Armatimonadota bacterium]NIM24298.1 membrane protein insertase YidC [Armatimonadota bacterium]NIM68167.1 membrane protein insertase YidC [Armatimonadota bacterium]NIM76627.1 membrane protein insertase YidC [Armatimonadota bacterium]NIN06372.1 membrane protein insertase YidC [Armatimonadota bacterium]